MAVVGLSVLVGSGGFWPGGGFWRVALAAASAMLVLGGGNALNDYYDMEADRINRPQRPLPRGLLEPRFVAGLGLWLMLLGVGAGWLISPISGLLATAVAAILGAYAVWGKKLSLIGNLMVAGACGAAFVYGGLASEPGFLNSAAPGAGGALRMSLIPAAFAFLMHLAREIIKDVQDLDGDRSVGSMTTAVALGPRRALGLAAGFLILLVMLTPLPFLLKIYGWRYLAAVVLGVDLMLAPIILWLGGEPDRDRLSKISFYIKIDMIVGIMAICLGLSG
jgi:geranylgeranylglycerol-phosphate geranylgeranyltransferase